jgi:protein-S-isoprenylcysteine O-methyltransferase Ste14
MLSRIAVFTYGAACYAVFLATFVYAIGFAGNIAVPKGLDSGPEGPLLTAIAGNSALLAVFALQHSVMARPWFKRQWTRLIPEPAERSTYVLFSSLAMMLLFWQWRPMGGVVWDIRETPAAAAVMGIYAFGWALLLAATFLINHFDLFGLRQVWLHLIGQPYEPLRFRTPGLYRSVRHPIYAAWMIIFWAAPVMTAAHLLFAVMTTVYMLIAIQWEERDLLTVHGEAYARYRKSVPMLIPSPARTYSAGRTESAARP